RQARALLQEAAFEPAAWRAALEAITRACQARDGQLIAVNRAGDVTVNLIYSPREEEITHALDAYEGFTDPRRNPRFSIGRYAPAMTPVLGQDHIVRASRRIFPIYAELYEPL